MTVKKLIISILLAAGLTSAADLALEDYWQLNSLRLELAAQEWQARITAAQQANGDRKAFLARNDAISKEFAGHHRTLHGKYGTTPQDYIRFGSTHAREIDSYLDAAEHAVLKRAIDQQRDRVQSLMQQFDAAAASLLKEEK